jgi:hypothetical protein
MEIELDKLLKELLKAATEFIPDPATRNILKAVIESMTKQTLRTDQKLERIEQKLDRLIGQHYKNGLAYLRDASLVSEHLRGTWINKALEEFIHAVNTETLLPTLVEANCYVGICYDLLGQPKASTGYYAEAYQMAYMQGMVMLGDITFLSYNESIQKRNARGEELELLINDFLAPLRNLLLSRSPDIPLKIEQSLNMPGVAIF